MDRRTLDGAFPYMHTAPHTKRSFGPPDRDEQSFGSSRFRSFLFTTIRNPRKSSHVAETFREQPKTI